jgi:hypothetical protein
VLLAFLGLQVYLFFVKDFRVQDHYGYRNEIPLPLQGKLKDKNVSQTFSVPGPLCRIDIMLANYKIKPEDGVLRLSIFQENRRVFLKNYPADTVEDNRFYSFDIQEQKETIPSGHYRLRLEFLPKNPTDRLAVWISRENSYPHGHLIVNGKRKKSDMTLRIYYDSTLWNARNLWLNPENVPGFRTYALSAGFILLLFMVNFLFYNLTNKLLNESDIDDQTNQRIMGI